MAGGGFKPSFWNLEAVLEAKPGTVYITEGEMDAVALVETGIPACQVLSVPNGAPSQAAHDPLSRGYAYVQDALKAGLGAVKRFVWCGDADEPGNALRADYVRILGAARFMYVNWPEGVKDPGDMLLRGGLLECVTAALPWPQEGLFKLSDIPTPPPLTIWTPDLFEGLVHLAPKTLSLVTGNPGHGKTICFGQIWYEIAKKYNILCCIASFETRPKPHIRRQLRTLLTGRLENELSEAECAQCDSWIDDHYLFLIHPEQRPSLEWILETAETAIIRHGAKVIQVDPWNRLEASRARDETETEYVLRCLRALYVFANDMNCHVQIVAHPSKVEGPRRGTPPVLEDVAGSKHWDNIIDAGYVVHRPRMFEGMERKTETDFYCRKTRFEELGYPVKIPLNYDLNTRSFVRLKLDD